jgi:hypothetical protein
MDQIVQTSPAPYPSLSPAGTETSFDASPIKNEDGSTPGPPKKKQKRNKPTLSCEECVERKTKVSEDFQSFSTMLDCFVPLSRGEGFRNRGKGSREAAATLNINESYLLDCSY